MTDYDNRFNNKTILVIGYGFIFDFSYFSFVLNCIKVSLFTCVHFEYLC